MVHNNTYKPRSVSLSDRYGTNQTNPIRAPVSCHSCSPAIVRAAQLPSVQPSCPAPLLSLVRLQPLPPHIPHASCPRVHSVRRPPRVQPPTSVRSLLSRCGITLHHRRELSLPPLLPLPPPPLPQHRRHRRATRSRGIQIRWT
jgi:hypothetical protein